MVVSAGTPYRLPTIKNLYLNFNWRRNIKENTDANHQKGFAYEDNCMRFEIAFEPNEIRDRTLWHLIRFNQNIS